jgi:hypothetical protein
MTIVHPIIPTPVSRPGEKALSAERVERRLAADVAGYSRLIGENATDGFAGP